MLGGGTEAELRQLRLAERDQSGRQEEFGEVTVSGLRLSLPGVRTLPGRHAFDVDVVLEERRHPVEVPARTDCRSATGPLEGLMRQAVERRVDRLGSADRGVDQFLGRDTAGAQSIDQPDGIEVSQRVVAEGMNVPHRPDLPSQPC